MDCLGSPTKKRRPGSGSSSAHRAPEASESAAAEQRGQLHLDRVGVLEFVDEQALVALPQGRPHCRAVGVVAQQQAGPHQQVVEFEASAGAPLLRGAESEGSQPGHEHLERSLCRPVQDLFADRQRVARPARCGPGS